MLFTCMNVCHECITIDSRVRKDETEFSGPSVDEVCFLEMTR